MLLGLVVAVGLAVTVAVTLAVALAMTLGLLVVPGRPVVVARRRLVLARRGLVLARRGLHVAVGVTPAVAVRDAESAVEAARPLGGHAVVLKIDAPALAHKSDLGLVRLGLQGDDAVRAAADDLLATARRHGIEARGLLVEPMTEAGVELIVGLAGMAAAAQIGVIAGTCSASEAERIRELIGEFDLPLTARVEEGQVLERLKNG